MFEIVAFFTNFVGAIGALIQIMLAIIAHVAFISGLQSIALGVGLFVLVIGLSQTIFYAVCIPYAWLEINKRSQRDDDHACWELMRSQCVPGISIIVPAYNEEATIEQSVLALLNLHYSDYQVIVVNDGSKDSTADTIIEKFGMEPTEVVRDKGKITHKPIRQIYRSSQFSNLMFVDKENGKKADAINTGITCVRTPLFCVIDADSLLEPKALLKAVRPFVESEDNVIAVGGTVGIVNGSKVENGQVSNYSLPRSILPLFQVVEYVRAYLMARLAACLLYTSPSPRDATLSRMPSSA